MHDNPYKAQYKRQLFFLPYRSARDPATVPKTMLLTYPAMNKIPICTWKLNQAAMLLTYPSEKCVNEDMYHGNQAALLLTYPTINKIPNCTCKWNQADMQSKYPAKNNAPMSTCNKEIRKPCGQKKMSAGHIKQTRNNEGQFR